MKQGFRILYFSREIRLFFFNLDRNKYLIYFIISLKYSVVETYECLRYLRAYILLAIINYFVTYKKNI